MSPHTYESSLLQTRVETEALPFSPKNLPLRERCFLGPLSARTILNPTAFGRAFSEALLRKTLPLQDLTCANRST